MTKNLNLAIQAYANNEATLDQLAVIQTWALGATFARGQVKIACRRVGIDGAALIAEIKTM